MTNKHTLDEQLKNLKRYKLFGGKLPLPGDIDPASRFIRAASFLKTLPEPRNEREALAFLRGVMFRITSPFGSQDTSGSGSSNVGPTRWLILYDPTNRTIYFMGIANLNLFRVSLEDVDLQEGALVQHFDPMDSGLCGEMFRLPRLEMANNNQERQGTYDCTDQCCRPVPYSGLGFLGFRDRRYRTRRRPAKSSSRLPERESVSPSVLFAWRSSGTILHGGNRLLIDGRRLPCNSTDLRHTPGEKGRFEIDGRPFR